MVVAGWVKGEFGGWVGNGVMWKRAEMVSGNRLPRGVIDYQA